jgi:hypothetical protein
MKKNFLDFINDPNHPWVVCLGVPYGTHLWQVADATELNGCFKIALCNAKRIYLTYREENKFVSTDVIPLVNMAFPLSFGRKENASKAILKRGWFPLTYVLLDHPKLLRVDQTYTTPDDDNLPPPNDTNDNTASTIIDAPSNDGIIKIVTTVNTTGTKTNAYIDKIYRHNNRLGGTKRKYEEEKAKWELQQEGIDILADIGQVTSGQLCLRNKWILDNTVRDKVDEKEEADKQKQEEIDQKKSLQEKETNKFKETFQRYVSNQRMNATDYRTLLRRVKQKNDSPLRPKLDGLMQQWQQRKHRIEDFIVIPVVAPTPVMEVVPPVVGANVPVPVGIFADITNNETMGGATSNFWGIEKNLNSIYSCSVLANGIWQKPRGTFLQSFLRRATLKNISQKVRTFQ